jgi:stress response protein YsnF
MERHDTGVTTTTTSETERTRVRAGETVDSADFSIPLYAERLQVGKREVDNGAVRLQKTVRTETVSEPITLQREYVVIDRVAFDEARRAADAGEANALGARFEEKTITIELDREEPVVQVEPYLTGRIVANKKMRTEQQTVQRQVRREEVQIIKNAADQDVQITERARNVRVEGVGAPGANGQRELGTDRQGERQNGSEQLEKERVREQELQNGSEKQQNGTNGTNGSEGKQQ